jgi:uncharacterized protein YjiS (DUF1127 family)
MAVVYYDQTPRGFSAAQGTKTKAAAAAVAGVTAAAAAIAAITGWWQAYRLWQDRTRAVRALQALEDHQLKDIGIDRAEIRSVVAHGRLRSGRK